MAKLLKIIGRSLGLLFEWLLIFIIFLAFAIRTSPVQTFLANQATAYLSDELGAEIKIDRLTIIFLDKVELEGVLVRDLSGDTLLAAQSIFASVDDYNLGKRLLHLGEVEIKKANIGLERDTAGVFNYQFIREYFTPKKKTKKKFTLLVDNVSLSDSRFVYDDNRHVRKAYGVDYFHIKAAGINAMVNDFKIENQEYSGTIESVNCREKSGFILDDLITEVKVASSGVYLTNVKIKSPGSEIEAEKFNMLSTGFTDFKSFVDSVTFDAKIDKSIIDLKEEALFAPILAGMNDTIQLTTAIYKKVKNLRLANLDLKIKDKTRIKGTFNIPDFRKFDQGFFHEKVDYAYLDINELKQIRLPDVSSAPYVKMNSQIERLGFFQAKNVRLDGFYSQFVVATERVHTRLGDIRVDNGIMFTENPKNNSYLFERSGASKWDVKVEKFNLGNFLRDDNLGYVDGIFFLSGEAFSVSDIKFSSIEGNVNRFDYLDYPYKNISIIDGSLEDKIFKGKIDVADDNLEMAYDGMIDFQGEPHLLFTVKIGNAVLDQLNFTAQKTEMSSVFTIDLRGKNPSDFRGTVFMDSFSLTGRGKTFDIPSLELEILRGVQTDEFRIESDIARGKLKGKLDFKHILSDLNYQLSRAFPAYFEEELAKRENENTNHFEFNFEINEADDFMAVFFPNLKIASGTTVEGQYYAEKENLHGDIKSDSIIYKKMAFHGIDLHQTMTNESVVANLHADAFIYNDSISFNDIFFKSLGKANVLQSDLLWEPGTESASAITWETSVLDPNHFNFLLDPSHFYVQEHKWEIAHASNVAIEGDTIRVNNFELTRNEQSIKLDGMLSNKTKHHLNFDVRDLEISEISNFISDVPLEGKMNSWGYVANPFRNFQYEGTANILQFKTRGQLVGDIKVESQWVHQSQSIALQGDLMYKGHQTFDFIGDYYPKLKKNNLDFNLFFEYTDIQFTNAFFNPEVVSEIKGLLNGTLKVTGTPDEPKMDGAVKLVAGSAKVELLGAHFGIEGPIKADKYGFYIDGIPVYDEDGNAGLLIGSIYHDNFKDFNFDLMFDLEDDAINKDPLQPWLVQPLDKFLVLNSTYEPGDLYYGTGYARGVIDVFGYTDNLEITVDLETRAGTKIDIPMYGIGEIEEESFIVFLDKDTVQKIEDPKIDFTGVGLNLNFHVTPAAELKLIFNEDLEDEITAHGNGDIDITLNNIGDVTMNGIFTVADGVYDFAMGPIKEKFYIEEGGSIGWTGDPYDAVLNLRTYYKVNANIAAATNDQFGSGSGAHQEVLCYLDLTESLMKPAIGFDLAAPQADEVAKSIITRIKSDPDELNRQFFSLLLWKRFQPLAGSILADGSAAIDLVTNQINAILAKVSDDYSLNVNMDSDRLTGDNTYEFGVSTGFLDDRLILSGSFGVENHKVDEDNNENSIIGDLELEYLLNESGTFRVNIFNESNDKTIIQNEDQGSFTQGAGLSYKEDFHTMNDFKAIQYFLDIFRKKKNKRYPIKRKRQQVPVPETEEIKPNSSNKGSTPNPEIIP